MCVYYIYIHFQLVDMYKELYIYYIVESSGSCQEFLTDFNIRIL